MGLLCGLSFIKKTSFSTRALETSSMVTYTRKEFLVPWARFLERLGVLAGRPLENPSSGSILSQ